MWTCYDREFCSSQQERQNLFLFDDTANCDSVTHWGETLSPLKSKYLFKSKLSARMNGRERVERGNCERGRQRLMEDRWRTKSVDSSVCVGECVRGEIHLNSFIVEEGVNSSVASLIVCFVHFYPKARPATHTHKQWHAVFQPRAICCCIVIIRDVKQAKKAFYL